MNWKSFAALAALCVIFVFTSGFWGIKSKGTTTHFEGTSTEDEVVILGSNLVDITIADGSGTCSLAVWSRGLANYDGSDVTTGIDTLAFSSGFKWEKNASLDSCMMLFRDTDIVLCIEVAN